MKKIRHNDQAGFISGFKVSLTFDNSSSSSLSTLSFVFRKVFFLSYFYIWATIYFPPKLKSIFLKPWGKYIIQFKFEFEAYH